MGEASVNTRPFVLLIWASVKTEFASITLGSKCRPDTVRWLCKVMRIGNNWRQKIGRYGVGIHVCALKEILGIAACRKKTCTSRLK